RAASACRVFAAPCPRFRGSPSPSPSQWVRWTPQQATRLEATRLEATRLEQAVDSLGRPGTLAGGGTGGVGGIRGGGGGAAAGAGAAVGGGTRVAADSWDRADTRLAGTRRAVVDSHWAPVVDHRYRPPSPAAAARSRGPRARPARPGPRRRHQ